MMKIVVITANRLKDFPPISTMLRVLSSLGHEITLITPSKDELANDCGIVQNLFIKQGTIDYIEKFNKTKLAASIAFRLDKIVRCICLRRIIKKYKQVIDDAHIVWIAHEDTAVLGGKYFIDHLPPFVYTMYELPLKLSGNKRIYTYAAQKAKALVTPEYCRAHIMKAIYSLSEVPYIIPNKPFEHPEMTCMEIEDPVIREKIVSIENSGKKIIMYMGILSNERPLDPIIDAVVKMRDKYEFVVLGPWSRYLDYIQEKYRGSFTYLGSLTPPKHLAVASHAHITFISYFPQNNSVNAVFCAPNKVYEFAGFGVPMLCNDVPGLKYQVEQAGMGICISDFTVDSIIKALTIIEDNYNEMKNAAKKYYNTENIGRKFNEIVSREC